MKEQFIKDMVKQSGLGIEPGPLSLWLLDKLWEVCKDDYEADLLWAEEQERRLIVTEILEYGNSY